MKSVTITQSAGSTGTFGPDVSTAYVGQSVSNLVLKANSPGAITANAADNIGGAFSYFSEFDYIKNSNITGWSALGSCYKIGYLFYYTNYAAYLTGGTTFSYKYKSMNGVICPTDNSTATVSTAALTISTGYLPSKWGKTLPGWGSYSQNTGHLLYLNSNYVAIGQDLVISGSVQLPPAGALLKRSVG